MSPLLEALISSRTRIKLLLRFFLNSNATAYLRGLEAEFGESSNAIRLELNRFEKAGMLTSRTEGNKKVFCANKDYPLFNEIHHILLKHIGFDKIVETVIERLGDIEKVFVTGELAEGRDSPIIDLVFIGASIDKNYLMHLIEKAESIIERKIRFLIYAQEGEETPVLNTAVNPALLLWSNS